MSNVKQDMNWYCVRTQVKREKLAAATLAERRDLEVFSPRIRLRRKTVRGLCWFEEALFPGYFFARFNLALNLRQVSYSIGVRGIVHFGDRYAAVPDKMIELLKDSVGDEDVTVDEGFMEGDRVLIADGPFSGLLAVVTDSLSGSERVKVLLDFLGQQVNVEVDSDKIVKSD